MRSVTRREFMNVSAAGAAAVSSLAARSRRVSANDRVMVAVIGLRGMGRVHVSRLTEVPDAVCATLCDVDQSMLDRESKKVHDATGQWPKMVKDFRQVLEDTSIDAVVVATPHHWHVPMAVRALRAGKDVYLEKPGSHVFREGRVLVDTAEETGRIVQHGTQMRSSRVTAKARELLDSGLIGEVKMSKAWNLQRHSHRKPVPDAPVPPGVDYDMWLGPAPKRPFNPNRFPRQLELVSRLTGTGTSGETAFTTWTWPISASLPRPIRSGSRPTEAGFTWRGVEREFPDNMMVAYHFAEGKVLIYEDRAWTPYGRYGVDSGNAFYGTEGFMIFSRRGFFQVYLGRKEEKGPSMGVGEAVRDRGKGAHLSNFLDCVRTRNQPLAPALQAHRSCALVHLGEAAYRTGKVLEFDPESETITNHPEANQLLTKEYRAPWGAAVS